MEPIFAHSLPPSLLFKGLIFSKNPLEDVGIVEDYENNMKLIVKDGQVMHTFLKT